MRLAGSSEAPKLCAMRPIIALAAALFLSSCADAPGTRFIDTLETSSWKAIATDQDKDRMRNWRTALEEGRAQAEASGHGAELAALGPLAELDSGLELGNLPDGDYRCRTIKLGWKGDPGLGYVAYPYFTCRIRPEKELLGFAKLTGSQRPVGLIFPDDDLRRVFLGTLVLGDEDYAMRYGSDPERDMAGMLQRIGDNQYRLLLPNPAFESKIDIIELVPAT